MEESKRSTHGGIKFRAVRDRDLIKIEDNLLHFYGGGVPDSGWVMKYLNGGKG